MIGKKAYVGIMVSNRTQRKYVLMNYLRFNTANIKLVCFTPSSISWRRKTIIGLYRNNRSWRQSRLPFPKVVYNCCYGLDQDLILRLEKIIGSRKCFNHINQFNKGAIYELLSKSDLINYLPYTIPYEKNKASNLLEIHNILYLKPCYGSKGKGVYRIEKKENGEIHISHNHFSPIIIVYNPSQFNKDIHELIGSTPYIIQRGIDTRQLKGRCFDIRVLVQKNQCGLWAVTNTVNRIAYNQYYNTSAYEKVWMSDNALKSLYPRDQVTALIHSINDVSLRATAIIETETVSHLGELSVDFVLDNDGRFWITEINGKPQKSLYRKTHHYRRVYNRPLQYAKFLLEKNL